MKRELVKIFFGVDASHHAVCRAVVHALTAYGLSPELSQVGNNYVLALKPPPEATVTNFRLTVSLNEAYFGPINGGQKLLSSYPVMAELDAARYHSVSEASGLSRKAIAVPFQDQVIEAILRGLQWPIIVTTASGELLIAYRPTIGLQRFKGGEVGAKSPSGLW